MNKKIIVMITLVLSFVLFVSKVEAAKTIVVDGYDVSCSDEKYDEYAAFKEQDGNSYFVCLDKKYSEYDIGRFTIMGTTVCADGSNCDDKRGNVSSTKPSYKCYTCSSSANTIWNYTIPKNRCSASEGWVINSKVSEEKNCKCDYGFSCSSRAVCSAKTNWLKKCEYVSMSGEDTVSIYFDKCLMQIYAGDEKLSTTCSVVGDSSIARCHDITLEKLLERYNKNGECPLHVYAEKIKITSPHLTADEKITYSLSGNAKLEMFKLQTNDDDVTGSYEDCKSLIGEEAFNLINDIMKWIRIIVPILLIVFGVIDFSGAVFGSKEEDMKKSRDRFIKRILAAVIVFLIPIFINLILELANSAWSWIVPNNCIE